MEGLFEKDCGKQTGNTLEAQKKQLAADNVFL